MDLGFVDPYTLEEKLEFVNGLVPENLAEVGGESLVGESDLGEERGEGEEGVFGDELGEDERNGLRGVEVLSKGFLGFGESCGFVVAVDSVYASELGKLLRGGGNGR